MSYGGFPPSDKTFPGQMVDILERVARVERRRSRRGGGGGGGGISTIVEGDGIEIVGVGSALDPMVISLDDTALLPALPAPVRYATGATHTPVATAFGTILPGTVVQSITVPRPTWVMVTFGAWMVSSAGETRAGIRLGGVTTVNPPNEQQTGLVGAGAWGQTLYVGASDMGSSTGAGQRTSQRVYLLNTGTTTFTIEAYIATAGTKAVNYPVLEIAPLYYQDTPVPVRPTSSASTKRYVSGSYSYAAVDTPVLFDSSLADAGHFTYNAANGEFTCLVAGQYNVAFGLGGGQVAAQNWIKGAILHNGVILSEFIGNRETVGGRAYHTNQTVTLAVGDKIQATAASSVAGGAITSNSSRSFIDITAVNLWDDSLPPAAVVGAVNGMKMAQGSIAVVASLAQDATVTVPVVFPVGLFTAPPQVLFTPGNSRITIAQSAVTTAGCNASVSNWSAGAMPSNQTVYWTAIGV